MYWLMLLAITNPRLTGNTIHEWMGVSLIAAIINRMLAKNRDHRFETARGVSAAVAPFAKPKHISFNFQQILDRRNVLAQQRKKLMDERAKRVAAQTSLSVCSLDSKTTRPPQAQIETSIHKDTRVGSKK